MTAGSRWKCPRRKSIIGECACRYADCLEFHPAGEATIGTGVLHDNGKTKGSRTFAIHNDANSGSSRMADWRIGTQVTVYAQEGGWYEVEFGGKRGWVRDKYLTLDE